MQGAGAEFNGGITQRAANVATADEVARARLGAERALLQVFLAMRVYHLSAGAVSLLFDRRRFRRPRLADAVWLVMFAESCWIARRCLARGRYDEPVAALVDTTAGCAGLVGCALALPRDDQFGPINWMFPLTLMSACGVSGPLPRRLPAMSAAGALAGTYTAAVMSQASGQRRSVIFGLWQYAGMYIGGDILLRRARSNAEAIGAARRVAVERAERLAREQVRNRLQRELHEHALEALEQIRALWAFDRPAAEQIARREAVRLRHALGTDSKTVPELTRRIEAVVQRLAGSGLRCELVIDEFDDILPDAALNALADAVEVALNNVVLYAQTRTATLRVTESTDAVHVVIRDHGAGSTHREPPQRLVTMMAAGGGVVRWWSVPERGTRVELEVPR